MRLSYRNMWLATLGTTAFHLQQRTHDISPRPPPSTPCRDSRNVRLVTCSSAAEGAVAWDLGAIWRALQVVHWGLT